MKPPFAPSASAGTPPMLAVWLIAHAVPERRREEFVGDLEELFVMRSVERGRAEARRCYWRQSANVIADAIRGRTSRRARSDDDVARGMT